MDPTTLAGLVDQLGLPLIATAVPIAVAGFKRVLPHVPTVWLPVLAALLGTLAEIALGWLAGVEGQGALAGAFAGLAGVGVRELSDQFRKTIGTRGGGASGGAGLRCAPLAAVGALALLLLAGCAGTPATRATVTLGVACDSYATALGQLTPHKAALTADQIARVDAIDRALVGTPAAPGPCHPASAADPGGAAGTVQSLVDEVRGLVARFRPQEE